MQKNDSYPTQNGPENVDDYPLSVRFAARRALLNAQIQAKITESSYKPEPFKCTRPKSGWIADWLDQDAD